MYFRPPTARFSPPQTPLFGASQISGSGSSIRRSGQVTVSLPQLLQQLIEIQPGSPSFAGKHVSCELNGSFRPTWVFRHFFNCCFSGLSFLCVVISTSLGATKWLDFAGFLRITSVILLSLHLDKNLCEDVTHPGASPKDPAVGLKPFPKKGKHDIYSSDRVGFVFLWGVYLLKVKHDWLVLGITCPSGARHGDNMSFWSAPQSTSGQPTSSGEVSGAMKFRLKACARLSRELSARLFFAEANTLGPRHWRRASFEDGGSLGFFFGPFQGPDFVFRCVAVFLVLLCVCVSLHVSCFVFPFGSFWCGEPTANYSSVRNARAPTI